MAGLSKSRIIQHRQCPKRLWLYVNRPELAQQDEAVTMRLNMGHQVGEVARSLYPQGVLIETEDAAQALLETAKVLEGKRTALFEAAFAYNKVFIRADLLLPARGGYRMVEVKSSTGVKDYYLEDAAIQSWVAQKAGLPVKRIEIAHIDTAFVYPGDGSYEGLFAYADVSKDAHSLGKEVPKWVRAAQATLAQKEEPDIEPGNRCSDPFECPFMAYCDPAPAEDVFPPEILPYKNGKALAAELREAGYEDLRKVPGARISSMLHQRIWRVTKKNTPELDSEAGKTLSALVYPRYYLDFETIQFAVPIWAGTSPYRQIPFQWSCHIEQKNGAVTHKAFLAKTKDPRRDFAEALIKTLKTKGPVLVYNAGFEAGRLKELADDFPDLAPQLDAIRSRFVDLYPLARHHYYHRDLRGSWSLKAVLPTIAPELAYDDLEVADGGMAQEAFAQILDPESASDLVRKLRKALLSYCERDTWALVRIARFFEIR